MKFKLTESEYRMNDAAIATFNFLLWAVAGAVTYSGLSTEPLERLLILIIIDTFFGSIKSILVGKNFTTHRLTRGVIGKIGLITIPFVFALAAQSVGADATAISLYAINIIILAEAYSIIANIYTIRTKKDLPEWEVTSIFLHKIQSLIETAIRRKDEP